MTSDVGIECLNKSYTMIFLNVSTKHMKHYLIKCNPVMITGPHYWDRNLIWGTSQVRSDVGIQCLYNFYVMIFDQIISCNDNEPLSLGRIKLW